MRLALLIAFAIGTASCSSADGQCYQSAVPTCYTLNSEMCRMCEHETVVGGRTMLEIVCYSDPNTDCGSGSNDLGTVDCDLCPTDPAQMSYLRACPQFRVELEFGLCCADGSGCCTHYCPLTACGNDIARVTRALKYAMCRHAASAKKQVSWYRIKIFDSCGDCANLCSCYYWEKSKPKCRPLRKLFRRRR